MKGYLYTITNKINNKKYVGKTIDLKHRFETHLSDLRRGKHHSIELQRAYNKYGEDNFQFDYKIVDVLDEKELGVLEQKLIQKYDSYKNGYNETLGGEGCRKYFAFEDCVILFQILSRYDGIMRQLGRYFNCDPSCFSNIIQNSILYEGASFDEKNVQEVIEKIGLSSKNLKSNYIPHNNKKLSSEQCYDILCVIKYKDGYDKTLCELFNIDSKLTYRLRRDLIYKDCCQKYNSLTEEDKEKEFYRVLKRYDLESLRAKRQRRGVRNPLTQEQVDYILDNCKTKSSAQIGRELDVSADRVRGIVKGTSYKDLVQNYKIRHNL